MSRSLSAPSDQSQRADAFAAIERRLCDLWHAVVMAEAHGAAEATIEARLDAYLAALDEVVAGGWVRQGTRLPAPGTFVATIQRDEDTSDRQVNSG